MSGENNKLPKRSKARVEVRHRAGAGQSARQPMGPPTVARIQEDRREEARRLAGLNDQPRRRKRGPEEPLPGWVVAVVGTVLLAVIVGIIWYAMGRMKPRVGGRVVTAEELRQLPGEPADEGLLGTLSPAEFLTTVEEAVRGFMDAGDDAGRCTFVSGGGAMEERMAEFYAREGNRPPDGFGKMVEISPVAFGGFLMQVVVADEASGGGRLAFNVLPAQERMLIDWESSVGYGEMGWDRLLEERPVEARQMRVFLKSDDYYNYEFADEKKYVCYRIRARESEELLYGYAERDSDTGRQLAEAVQEGSTVPVNLRLRFLPDQKDGSMVVIDSLIHPFWVDPGSVEERVKER